MTKDTQDQITQKASYSLHGLLTRPNTTIAKKDWAHGMIQIVIAKLCDYEGDIESVNSDINDITEKLKQKDLALREKDNEILRLKAETRALQNQIQKLNASMQQQQQYYANMFTNGSPVFLISHTQPQQYPLIRAP